MSGATPADRHVHPATVPLRLLKEAPRTVVGIPAAYAVVSDQGLAQVLLVAAAAAMLAILFQWIAWRRFRYGIGLGELVIESGVLSRTRRSIPFDRIQDVDIERGPLQRLFGLARLRIETGGSASDEGVLDSVTLAEAERLQAALRSSRGAARSDDGAGAGAARSGRLLFAMGVPRVLAAGLFNFSLVYIAGVFALLQWAESWLPVDLYDPRRWAGLAERFGGTLDNGALAAVALVALLLGVLTGIVRAFARDFGFRLTLDPAGFRRERGLFTRSEVLIPNRRVQLALVESGPLRRHFGFALLAVQTLGGGNPGEGGRQVIAPLARRSEVDLILACQDGLRLAEPAALDRVSGLHLVHRFILTGLAPLLAILAVAILVPPVLAAAALLPFALAAAMLARRFRRYGIIGKVLHVHTGFLRRRQWMIPLGQIQGLRIRRSWLQRRLGLATLAIDTAGGSALDPPRILDLREGKARALAEALLVA